MAKYEQAAMIGTIPWMIVSASSACVRRLPMNRIAAAPAAIPAKPSQSQNWGVIEISSLPWDEMRVENVRSWQSG